MRAYTATLKDKDNTIFANFDKSTFIHPFAKEFVFKHKDNKYIFHLKGSMPKIFSGLLTWKFFSKFQREPLSSLSLLYGLRDTIKDPILYYRHKLLPFDNTIFSNLYKQFGLLALADTLYLSTLLLDTDIFDKIYLNPHIPNETIFPLLVKYLKEKNLTLEEFAKQKQYTLYEELRLFFEKVSPVINDDLTLSVAIRDFRIKDIEVTLYKKRENSSDFEEIATLSQKNFVSTQTKTFGKIDISRLLGPRIFFRDSSFLTKDTKLFLINNTQHYIVIKDNLTHSIVKPYGIVEVSSKDIIGYKLPYIYAQVTSINENTEFSTLFEESNPKNIGGYNIKAKSYYINSNIKHFDTHSNELQIGPALFKGISKIDGEFRDFVRLPKANYEHINTKETKSMILEIRYVNKDLFYREKGSVSFKKAQKINGFYVTDDGYVLAQEAFLVFEDYIDFDENFIYNRDFLRKDNKTYQILSNALNPRGLAIYSDKYFYKKPPNICLDNIYIDRANTIEYAPYDLIDVEPDKFGFFAKSDVDGKRKYYDLRVKSIIGLTSDSKMYLTGASVIYEDLPLFKHLRSYKNNGKLFYYIVSDGQKEYIIAFPLTSYTDSFIDVDNSPEGICQNPKKLGPYDIQKPKDFYPLLYYSVASYSPDGNTLTDVKSIELDSYKTYPVANLTNIKTPDEYILFDIKPYFYMLTQHSKATELLDKKISYSQLTDKKYAIIDEIGLILDITSLNVDTEFKITKEIIDKDIRGLQLKSNSVTIEATIYGEYRQTKTISVKVYNKDKLITHLTQELVPFYLTEGDTFDGLKSVMNREKEIIVGFVYEAFINQLAKRGLFKGSLIDYDESNGVIIEKETKFSLEKATEGYRIKATLLDKEVDIINYPGALYYIYYSQPYLVYGKLNVMINTSFIFKPLHNSDNELLQQELITQAKSKKASIYYNYDIFTPNNIFSELKVFYDMRYLVLEDKEITLPKNHRAKLRVFLGEGNSFYSSNGFTTMDDVYQYINGVVVTNKSQDNAYIVEYYKIVNDIALHRKITIDLKEQTFFFASYYNNAKAQLIQDLREDTVQKRIDGAYIDIEFDTDHIYESIHTIKDKVWNVPVNFRCSTIKDEARLNKMRLFPLFEATELEYDDVFNSQGSLEVVIQSSTTLSLKNGFIEVDRVSYNVRDIALRLKRKELLYNDTNLTSYIYNENFKRKDIR